MSDRPSPLVIHLAAGQGTRLRPLTNDRPKPLVEIRGRSLLERNLETMSDAGITDQLVVTGYRAEQIEQLDVETVRNPVYAETDMVYSLFCARKRFPDESDLVISYGDIVYHRKVVDELLACDAPVCVVVDDRWEELWSSRFEDPLADAETLRLDDDYRITEIGQEPTDIEQIEAQYIGLLKIRNDMLSKFSAMYDDLSTPDAESDLAASVEMTHFLQELIDSGTRVQAVPVNGGWLEVDTLADLELYQDELFNDELPAHARSLN